MVPYQKMRFTIRTGERLTDLLIDRYHFEERQREQLNRLAEQAAARTEPCICYRIVPQQKYDRMVRAIVTLGAAWTLLQEQRRDVEEQYMLDCVGLEFLRQGYEQLIPQIRQETGEWVGAMEFIGEQRPIQELPEFMADFPDCGVSLVNGMLRPEKSVALVLPLSVIEPETSALHICGSCSQVDCPMRAQGGCGSVHN